MSNPAFRRGSTGFFSRKCWLALAMSAAVVLSAACSAPGDPAPSAEVSSARASAQPTPSSSSNAAPATSSLATGPTTAPTAQTAVKELIEGFPSIAVPLMSKAQTQVSSIERSGPVWNAAMTATITASTAEVLAYYTKVFTDQGFTAQPGELVDGLPLKTFVRSGGQELATVSVIDNAGTATFTVGVTLLQASFK